jgi:putative zinc finger protein/TonB-like protein
MTMSCRTTQAGLSAYRDGDLPTVEAQALAAHLETCPGCRARWEGLTSALDLLAELPRVESREPIAARILDRLDFGRQPGLAQLFRTFGAARPLMLPSLVPAVLVVTAVVVGALTLDRGSNRLPEVSRRSGTESWVFAPSGTESNPLFPSAEVSTPRIRAGAPFPDYLLGQTGEGSLFVETVVARDGTVSAVNLLEGDSAVARPVLDALRHERFEPGRYRGRPVAVSIYRLISHMEVRPPVT